MRFTKMHGSGNDFIVTIGWQEQGRWLVTLHNADGSLGESCGNRARCLGRYLLDRHGGDSVVFEGTT